MNDKTNFNKLIPNKINCLSTYVNKRLVIIEEIIMKAFDGFGFSVSECGVWVQEPNYEHSDSLILRAEVSGFLKEKEKEKKFYLEMIMDGDSLLVSKLASTHFEEVKKNLIDAGLVVQWSIQ